MLKSTCPLIVWKEKSVTATRLSYPWVIYHAYGILFLGGEGEENHDYNSEFTSQRQQAEFE